MAPLRIFVVVATVGRAEVTRRTVDLLADQTRPPDGVLVVGAQASDVEGVELARSAPEIVLAERGLCKQRNRSLELLADRADIIVFFDDDYVASPDFIEQTAGLFSSRPDLVGATGWLIADGIRGDGYSVDEALALIGADRPDQPPAEWPSTALYGCNMIVRLSATEGLRFDENLPLYGWQEDIDFTFQLGRRGPMVKSSLLRGVHMGAKGARSPGRRLGYSQIANPVYLLRKGTMPPELARRLIWKNLVANVLRSLKPEPTVDRRGRVTGNVMAIADLTTGRMDPRRILDMR